jgi:hypothetical protein
MREATGRYISYDGKFWKTLGALLLRPGFLTHEYLDGRRRRYIGPARLFLVSSLLLFATLRFATDSIDFAEAVQFDAPKEPRVKLESPRSPGSPRTSESKTTPGDFLMLDDDFNLNLSELAGTKGILQKPIARFNSLSRTQKIEQLKAGTLRYGPMRCSRSCLRSRRCSRSCISDEAGVIPRAPRLYGEHLVFAAHNHAFLFVVGSLVTCAVARMVRRRAGDVDARLSRWATRVVYGGRWLGIAARAMVLGFAYLILFGFVTIGLIVAAVLLR